MKVNIEVWQSNFNDEWMCDITTSDGNGTETESWSVDNFCALLNLLDKKIPGAKCIAKDECDE